MINLTFKREELLKALDYCNSSIDRKHPMTILTCILFDFKDNECTLNATNLETTVIAKVQLLESSQEGKIAIPAKSIYNICSVSRSDTIIFKYDESNNVLNITADKSKYNISCSNYEDFTDIPKTLKEFKNVNISRLISSYRKVQFSMGEFNINRSYSGVLITKVKNSDGSESIELVTTDIHRLSVLTLKNFSMDVDEIEDGLVVPGKNFFEITKIFSDSENAEIAIDDDKIFVKNDKVIFISRLLQNEFPKYRSVVGTYEEINNKEAAVINRKELIEAIKRVTVLSSEEKIWASKYFFKGQVLEMEAHSNNGGSSTDEILIEKGFSTDRSVAVNAKYFLDVISVIDDENVNVIVEDGPKAMTIKEENDNYLYIHMVMPLRI